VSATQVRCGNPACGEMIDESPDTPADARIPCPRCGSARRTFESSASIRATSTVTAELSVDRWTQRTAARRNWDPRRYRADGRYRLRLRLVGRRARRHRLIRALSRTHPMAALQALDDALHASHHRRLSMYRYRLFHADCRRGQRGGLRRDDPAGRGNRHRRPPRVARARLIGTYPTSELVVGAAVDGPDGGSSL
jgi:hypothetical protein